MTTPSGTPTPWMIDRDDRPDMEWNNHIVSRDDRNSRVCFMACSTDDNNATGEANAALIVESVNNYATLRADRDRLREENKKLLTALKAAKRAIGNHHAPGDCYATGPMTGDAIADLVACPACAAIPLIDEALQSSTGAA